MPKVYATKTKSGKYFFYKEVAGKKVRISTEEAITKLKSCHKLVGGDLNSILGTLGNVVGIGAKLLPMFL